VILVDTSVWIDHLHAVDRSLAAHLIDGRVACHPFVIGELAVGSLRSRTEILGLLGALPAAPIVSHAEVLTFIEVQVLMGLGLGWIDVHLLASARLAGYSLWTKDRRLARVASRLGVAQ
jgi:predicted nucleic acid-binding protein